MKDSFKSIKIKPSFEINWNIREIFSEAVLSNFCNDIDIKSLEKENNKF